MSSSFLGIYLLFSLSLCGLLGRTMSQPCLYNYTIGSDSPVIITQSDPVCLICSNTGNDMWEIPGTSTLSVISGVPYILYVTSPAITFSGGRTVACYASSRQNLTSSTVYIAAPAVPQVVTYVNESDALNLTCSNVMTVSSLAIEIFGQSWLDAHGNVVSNAASYSVPLVNRTAAGNYICVTRLIRNANGVINVTASTLVVVYYPPKIVSPQPTAYMVHSLSVQLNCTFDGLPVPAITWTFPNGSVITSQPRFLVQSTNTFTSLTISSLGGMDNGTYTCSASNSIGVSSTTVQLFLNAPVPPDTPLNLMVTYVSSSSISLSWTNGFDGYSPLTSVIISYEVDQYPQEGTRNQTFTYGTTATLIGLNSNSRYTILVRLVNAAGLISNPTSITQVTAIFTPPSNSPTPTPTSGSTSSTTQLCAAMWIYFICVVCFILYGANDISV